ncbi:MAG: glutamine--fructose-6-phosphate transaminase (isomerizing) [Candidatus Marinimicrobia bacterium]|nr:glutamine--fructose-6-phosphate transaminase (isomerizing) [Candidatus Neomarinimicrobiota bacterium]|tara:strand:- start:1186 stop:3021 length:1836 start_codon:yes stop_codon:yes gene_type:complete
MCGIVGYIGHQRAADIIIQGLKRLEYRGYDSAGLSTIENKMFYTSKCKGKISDLQKLPSIVKHNNSIGIGHTRWATHGEPNTNNAHPHHDYDKKFSLIHNGIIENHYSIKEYLLDKGVEFSSDTDTEVLVQFISYLYKNNNLDFYQTVKLALQEVVGTYGIVIMCSDEPQKVIAAKKGSPLLLGIGNDEIFLASDVSAILDHTRNILYLDDDEIVQIESNNYKINHITHEHEIIKDIKEIEYTLDQIEKGNYKHFMLKEIFEQPKSIIDSIRGRIDANNNVKLGGIDDYVSRILDAEHIFITACGTSWHAAQIGSYLLEDILKKPIKVEYASEFRYHNKSVNEKSLVIAISQSGETADTLAAINKAKNKNALTLGIVNVVGSAIARETDCGIYMHAGPEIGVASTKAFTIQVVILTLLANLLAQKKGFKQSKKYLDSLKKIPNLVTELLSMSDDIFNISKSFINAKNFLYLGRGYQFPVALEGALKLKEISYIHAEGYPAAEMKHGPIALIDNKMPVVVIVTEHGFDKILSNIQEVKSRGGKIITISTVDSSILKQLSDYYITLNNCSDIPNALTPLLTSIPLQLLAYHIAVLKGCNVDQPRNLAKSVTVE